MTDQQILTEVQYALIESPDGGLTVSSGLWTPDELQDAINAAQQWMIREVWPVVTRTTIPTVPNQSRHPLPQTWIETIRVGFTDADGDSASLGRDSTWSADYLDPAWTYTMSSRPLAYSDAGTPVPQLQLMPAASDNGLIDVWYAALPTELSNTGVAWAIPDYLVYPCKWKALAILLAKDGRGQDLPRAQAALARAMEGLEAAKIMVGGWHAGL